MQFPYKKTLSRKVVLWLASACLLTTPHISRAEHLFIGTGDFDFIDHAWADDVEIQYSVWNKFYARHQAGGNYPDVFAPFGGTYQGTDPNGIWVGVLRSEANAETYAHIAGDVFGPNGWHTDFEQNPLHYPNNSFGPVAFWDARNATITQTAGTYGQILLTGDGNIYSFQIPTAYRLDDSIRYITNLDRALLPTTNPNYQPPVYAKENDMDAIGTVVFQFQTEGSQADFSSIYLQYVDSNNVVQKIYASDTALGSEYLREYQTSSSDHASAQAGYTARVAIQWDLTGLGITDYSVFWNASSSSMSFQEAVLMVTDTYESAVASVGIWKTSATKLWSDTTAWQVRGSTLPQTNGNLRFDNTDVGTLTINNSSKIVGEVIFNSAYNMTINNSSSSYKLISNTGLATRNHATGVYNIDVPWELSAVNFFDIKAGTVNMNQTISSGTSSIGSVFGIVKTGAGTLNLNATNSFGSSNGFLVVNGGTVKVGGNNVYTGGTSVVIGDVIVATSAATPLGTLSKAISLGADSNLYAYTSGGATLESGLFIEGANTLAYDINLAAGTNIKRIGARQTGTAGATFSGAINLSIPDALGDDPNASSDKVYLTTASSTDKVTFTGTMINGATDKSLTIQGPGVVHYGGVNKAYKNATIIDPSATLKINTGTSHTGAGSYEVKSGGNLIVNGGLAGTGPTATLTLTGGLLGGTGTVQRNVVVNTGDTISPGDNSIGKLTFGTTSVNQSVTFGPDGTYVLDMSDANTTLSPGTTWDMIEIYGNLVFDSTTANRFIVNLNVPGSSVAGFNNQLTYDWTILSATGGISGLTTSNYAVNDSDFDMANPNEGHWSLSVRNGTDLVLTYSLVPEPGRSVFIILGLAFLTLRRRRQS